MIPAEVRDYLRLRRRAPLSDLVVRFEVEADALRAMLNQWAGKGRVRKVEAASGKCGGCCGCAEKLPEIYEWVSR